MKYISMIGSNLKKVRSTSTTNEIHFYDGGNLKIDSFEDFPRLTSVRCSKCYVVQYFEGSNAVKTTSMRN